MHKNEIKYLIYIQRNLNYAFKNMIDSEVSFLKNWHFKNLIVFFDPLSILDLSYFR